MVRETRLGVGVLNAICFLFVSLWWSCGRATETGEYTASSGVVQMQVPRGMESKDVALEFSGNRNLCDGRGAPLITLKTLSVDVLADTSKFIDVSAHRSDNSLLPFGEREEQLDNDKELTHWQFDLEGEVFPGEGCPGAYRLAMGHQLASSQEIAIEVKLIGDLVGEVTSPSLTLTLEKF